MRKLILLLACGVAWGQTNTVTLCDQQASQHCMTLSAPATLTADFAMQLPAANATGALTNDGAGNLSWGPGGSGAYLPLAGGTMTGSILMSGAHDLGGSTGSQYFGTAYIQDLRVGYFSSGTLMGYWDLVGTGPNVMELHDSSSTVLMRYDNSGSTPVYLWRGQTEPFADNAYDLGGGMFLRWRELWAYSADFTQTVNVGSLLTVGSIVVGGSGGPFFVDGAANTTVRNLTMSGTFSGTHAQNIGTGDSPTFAGLTMTGDIQMGGHNLITNATGTGAVGSATLPFGTVWANELDTQLTHVYDLHATGLAGGSWTVNEGHVSTMTSYLETRDNSGNVVYDLYAEFGGALTPMLDLYTDILEVHRIIPGADNTYILGAPTLRWSDLYVVNMHCSGTGCGLVNPMTQVGDIIYGGTGGTPSRLAGITSSTRKFLMSQGLGGLPNLPIWSTLQSGDIPTTYVFPSTYPGGQSADMSLGSGGVDPLTWMYNLNPGITSSHTVFAAGSGCPSGTTLTECTAIRGVSITSSSTTAVAGSFFAGAQINGGVAFGLNVLVTDGSPALGNSFSGVQLMNEWDTNVFHSGTVVNAALYSGASTAAMAANSFAIGIKTPGDLSHTSLKWPVGINFIGGCCNTAMTIGVSLYGTSTNNPSMQVLWDSLDTGGNFLEAAMGQYASGSFYINPDHAHNANDFEIDKNGVVHLMGSILMSGAHDLGGSTGSQYFGTAYLQDLRVGYFSGGTLMGYWDLLGTGPNVMELRNSSGTALMRYDNSGATPVYLWRGQTEPFADNTYDLGGGTFLRWRELWAYSADFSQTVNVGSQLTVGSIVVGGSGGPFFVDGAANTTVRNLTMSGIFSGTHGQNIGSGDSPSFTGLTVGIVSITSGNIMAGAIGATGNIFTYTSFSIGGTTVIDSSRNASFNNLTIGGTCTGCGLTNPMTTQGDIIYGALGGAPHRLAANASVQRQFLVSLTFSGVPQPPAWSTLSSLDIPDLSATYLSLSSGGTIYGTTAFQNAVTHNSTTTFSSTVNLNSTINFGSSSNAYMRTFFGTPNCTGVADGWFGFDTSGTTGTLWICKGGVATAH